jgi:hypothetical protein
MTFVRKKICWINSGADAIDVCTGVHTNGTLDEAKLAAFMEQVQFAASLRGAKAEARFLSRMTEGKCYEDSVCDRFHPGSLTPRGPRARYTPGARAGDSRGQELPRLS